MLKRRILAVLLAFICLASFSAIVEAATITAADPDKETYRQGQTGYISVTVYNDEEEKIRVTELTAQIDYYYTDGNTYLQTFFSDDILPVEIERGESANFRIPFSLPTNIASGYTNILVKAKTEIWNEPFDRWFGSDHPIYWVRLFTESPYKQYYMDQQAFNDQLQDQLQELQAVNNTTTNIMYLLGIVAIAFAAVAVFLVFLNRRPRTVSNPAA